jgi:hypothetical protein
MKIVRHQGEIPEIEIESTAEDLREIGRAIWRDVSSIASAQNQIMRTQTVFTAPQFDLTVISTVALLRIDAIDGKLLLAGDARCVLWLVSYFEYLASAGEEEGVSDHVHIEWDEGHPYLSENSIPMILYKQPA